ncbi:MAG TPA: signal peptidase II [Clostridia bacterium]|nr:signal peptidase II [Clostridia bacterium]
MEEPLSSHKLRTHLRPLWLSLAIIVTDQISKALIVASIPLHSIGAVFLDGFLRIIHTRNLAIAFSIGRSLSEQVRTVLFIILPLILLVLIVIYFIKTDDFTRLQRWAVAGIIGGGFGNMIDRLFRPEGVVDFVDVRFYGLFGLERWPTFNVADSSVVVAGIVMAASFILEKGEQDE